jgi:hypothetical protein
VGDVRTTGEKESESALSGAAERLGDEGDEP